MTLFWGNIKLSPSLFFILIRFGPDESSTNRTPKLVITLIEQGQGQGKYWCFHQPHLFQVYISFNLQLEIHDQLDLNLIIQFE